MNLKQENNLDWRLVALLSIFGLAMAFATVFIIPSNIEPFAWLVIFIVCAIMIARVRSTRHFLHGLLVGVANSVWITTVHLAFFDHYVANHPAEASMMAASSRSPRLMMAIVGPVIGVASGLILGALAQLTGYLAPHERPQQRKSHPFF